MHWLFRFRNSSANQWALLTLIIGCLVIAGIPVFERVMQFADDVEFRYLANAFEGSAQNIQMRSALKTENKQSDIVTVDNVNFRMTQSNQTQNGFPFALENGAKQLSDLTADDCGALFSQLTDQSYWLETDTRPEALKSPQPTVRAVVIQDTDNLLPYCRFERPVRTGFWRDGESDFLDHHVFTYYPVTGRVEVLRENQEK
ncbi:hypothetical protein [Enterovibrio calviensis]|uniref:hypothetical protein n=1 Tax=Enterovibrio calviensis TaxID=91359 RepID=UPI00048435E5|nr:hypothetical protein [Enterovibrio calviensis]